MLVVELDESVRTILRRGLRPSERKPFKWVIEALEGETVRDEAGRLSRREQSRWFGLIGEFMAIMEPRRTGERSRQHAR